MFSLLLSPFRVARRRDCRFFSCLIPSGFSPFYNPSVAFGDSSLYTREPFFFTFSFVLPVPRSDSPLSYYMTIARFSFDNKKPPPERRRLSGVPERIRTADLPLRRRTLYPAELRKHLLYPTTPRAKIQPRRHKKDIAFCLAPEEFVQSVGRHTEIYEQSVNSYARV